MTIAAHSDQGTAAWGPLAEPIHPDAAGTGDPVWKDNAYLSFWDVEHQVFGSLHLSTSPNGDGHRRARCSIILAGTEVEIVEPLEPGSFTSTSIHFGLDGAITVDHPDLTAEFTNTPLFTPADFARHELIPALVEGKPLRHFQQACVLRGSATAQGRTHQVDGYGMRDRTWGFRDEAAQWAEYAGLVAVFEESFLSAMKFLGNDGTLRSDGYLIDERGPCHIDDIRFTRSAAAQFVRAALRLEDGSTRTVAMHSREAGFFVPMGVEREGPTFGTYDDFMRLDLDDSPGAGFFEAGIVHRVF